MSRYARPPNTSLYVRNVYEGCRYFLFICYLASEVTRGRLSASDFRDIRRENAFIHDRATKWRWSRDPNACYCLLGALSSGQFVLRCTGKTDREYIYTRVAEQL